jgi:thioesterase domain-containing protein
MARRYVREIRGVQPHGPYLLAGRCYGALVAVEATRLLEAQGERVALLAAIDSIGPFWAERRLANGMRYDEVMNLARVRGREDGVSFGDIFGEPDAASAFVDWLRETVTANGPYAISRYLYAAYLARPDLRDGYPLTAGGHAGLLDWAWIGGRSEMGMNAQLLTPPSAFARKAKPSIDPRRTTRPHRAKERLLDVADVASRGKIAALAERRRTRLLALATENVLNYRAGRFAAPVALIRSQDDEDDTQKAQLARWYGLESGGVEVHYVRGSHHGMLREPDVASLAECLEGCIDRALAKARA